ncbi:hypothetical protein SG34_019255 [Thalassomonas viridans]|uniref:Uncharacterized protein n=1 Tax=Thalassomonas viridans TaxID=137584 RepID=A0AAE9YZW3_9GAMM|nr:hypothetical protein [Thalassomonas viridans]WDE03515.1 hypothetical protein SG34_019255 [Thalassomonas viridans]
MKTALESFLRNPVASDLERQISSLALSDEVSLSARDPGVLSAQTRENFTSAVQDYAAVNKLLKQQLQQQFANAAIIPEEQLVAIPGYDAKAEELAVHFVTSNFQQGLNQGSGADELTEIINKASENVRTAYSNTSSILEALGQLGPEQQSFISKSEHKVERALTGFAEDYYRSERGDSDKQLFELSVTTREGDVVHIQFSSGQGYDHASGNILDSFELSYEVEGELSEQEHQALQGIFSQVGQMADDYFSRSQGSAYNVFGNGTGDHDFTLDVLKGFDTGQLTGVDLSIGVWDGGEDDLMTDRLDYSYAFDVKNRQQSLEFDWVSAGARQVSFAIDSSAIGRLDEAQLAQYLEVIDNSHHEVRQGQVSSYGTLTPTALESYKTALSDVFSLADQYTRSIGNNGLQSVNDGLLTADLTNELIQTDPRYQNMASDKEQVFKEGFSLLADFDSSFNLGKEDQRGHINLVLKQETFSSQSLDYTGVEQTRAYDAATLRGYAETGTKAVETSEQYNIKAAAKGGEVLAVDQEHKFTRAEQKSASIGGGISRETQTVTESIDTSSLRLIEDIWTQDISHKKDTTTESKTLYGAEVKYQSRISSHEAGQTSTLIADMDKLKSDKFMREKYAPELMKVNQFMLKI